MLGTEVLKFLSDVFSNETINALIIAVLAGLLPATVLEKFKFISPLVKAVLTFLERVQAESEAKKVAAGAQIADQLVQGTEQLKALGKLDSHTAAAKVSKELQDRAKLDSETARTLTEGAVRKLKQG